MTYTALAQELTAEDLPYETPMPTIAPSTVRVDSDCKQNMARAGSKAIFLAQAVYLHREFSCDHAESNQLSEAGFQNGHVA